MQPLSTDTLLTAWEMGRARHPIDRSLLLYSIVASEMAPDTLADKPLGQLNQALLGLRQTTFGNRMRSYLDCPSCGERLEFYINASELLINITPQLEECKPVQVKGRMFRLPTSRDLAAIAQERESETAVLALLARCLLNESIGEKETMESFLLSSIDEIEAALEQADPASVIAFDLRCEFCGHAWAEPFDIAAFLWEEIEARARMLLDEVHLLARAYGWREADILALSEGRRAAYLERVSV